MKLPLGNLWTATNTLCFFSGLSHLNFPGKLAANGGRINASEILQLMDDTAADIRRSDGWLKSRFDGADSTFSLLALWRQNDIQTSKRGTTNYVNTFSCHNEARRCINYTKISLYKYSGSVIHTASFFKWFIYRITCNTKSVYATVNGVLEWKH